MYTLQEFIVYTKGWEYIIAVAFVTGFIVFWRLLSGVSPLEEEKYSPAEAARPFEEPEGVEAERRAA